MNIWLASKSAGQHTLNRSCREHGVSSVIRIFTPKRNLSTSPLVSLNGHLSLGSSKRNSSLRGAPPCVGLRFTHTCTSTNSTCQHDSVTNSHSRNEGEVSNHQEVRVRYAPSPTGSLHLGGLRTALYNYIFARNRGGKNILRIEDTDRTRLVPHATEQLLRDLKWAGIEFDEGPNGLGGQYGPYVQSERLHLYRKYADELLAKGHAYRCFCTPQRLEELRKRQTMQGGLTTYDRFCSQLTEEEVSTRVARGDSNVIRMRMPEGVTVVNDMVRGPVTFQNKLIDDQVLMKSDGFPTYHLANIVDDHLMRITHVIRGEEWLPSVVKHAVLYDMFGWQPPQFAHLPLLLREDGSKLSKRYKDASLDHYMQKGYLPEAMINFVAFLGWTPGITLTEDDVAAAPLPTSPTSPASSSSSSSSAPSSSSSSSPSTPVGTPENAAAALKKLLADTRTKKGRLAVASANIMKEGSGSGNSSKNDKLNAANDNSTTNNNNNSSNNNNNTPKEEASDILTMPQLISAFSFERVGKSGAAVEQSRLNFIHSQWWKIILKYNINKLIELTEPRVLQLISEYETLGNKAIDPILAGHYTPPLPQKNKGNTNSSNTNTNVTTTALSPSSPSPSPSSSSIPSPTDDHHPSREEMGVCYTTLSLDPRTTPSAIPRALRLTHGHPCLLSEFPHRMFFVWARPDLTSPHAMKIRDSFWKAESDIIVNNNNNNNNNSTGNSSDVTKDNNSSNANDNTSMAVDTNTNSTNDKQNKQNKTKPNNNKNNKNKQPAVMVSSKQVLLSFIEGVSSFPPECDNDVIATTLEVKKIIAKLNVSMKDAFLPVRFALSGTIAGPGVGDQIVCLGKEEVIWRLKHCYDTCP